MGWKKKWKSYKAKRRRAQAFRYRSANYTPFEAARNNRNFNRAYYKNWRKTMAKRKKK